MSFPWYWWFVGKSLQPGSAETNSSRKRDKIRKFFSKRKKPSPISINPNQTEDQADPPEEVPADPVGGVNEEEIQPKSTTASEAVHSQPVPITIEEVPETTAKGSESFTLLKVLRLGWMRSQATKAAPEVNSVHSLENKSVNMPRSLYFLQDIGHGTSTTEVSNATGMQA